MIERFNWDHPAAVGLHQAQRDEIKVRFYSREDYERVANFGYYAGPEQSLCFAKEL